MDGLKDKEELMTKIFGFPDEETLLQLLQKEFPQPVVEISEMCPNCESPSMSSTHICDNENDWFFHTVSKSLKLIKQSDSNIFTNSNSADSPKTLCATNQNIPPTQPSSSMFIFYGCSLLSPNRNSTNFHITRWPCINNPKQIRAQSMLCSLCLHFTFSWC